MAGAASTPVGIQGIYRMERNEQERERNLQSRYQVLLRCFQSSFLARETYLIAFVK